MVICLKCPEDHLYPHLSFCKLLYSSPFFTIKKNFTSSSKIIEDKRCIPHRTLDCKTTKKTTKLLGANLVNKLVISQQQSIQDIKTDVFKRNYRIRESLS
jgi:hypothetical protein